MFNFELFFTRKNYWNLIWFYNKYTLFNITDLIKLKDKIKIVPKIRPDSSEDNSEFKQN